MDTQNLAKTDPQFVELAQEAYDAYGATTDYKNYQGNPMPKWNDLPEKIRQAWVAATVTVTAPLMLRVMELESAPAFERGELHGQDQMLVHMQKPDALEGNSRLSEVLRELRTKWLALHGKES